MSIEQSTPHTLPRFIISSFSPSGGAPCSPILDAELDVEVEELELLLPPPPPISVRIPLRALSAAEPDLGGRPTNFPIDVGTTGFDGV